MSSRASTPTEDYAESLVSDISTCSNHLCSNSSFSDTNFNNLVEAKAFERAITDQSNYEMKELCNASNCKDNIIKILQDQLNTLHRKHKETIDDVESLKFKYNNAQDELANLKKICAQYENEIKKYEREGEHGTAKQSTVSKEEGNFTDATLQDIAIKIADVEGKVEAVKQIVSESDVPGNVSDDIDKVNNEYKNLLRRQYDRIEDILCEHSTKLDDIKERVCGDVKTTQAANLRFSIPNVLINSDISNNHEESIKPNVDSSKVNLLLTLRLTNEMLTNEIEDLREQLQYCRQTFHLGAMEFVEDVIEKAQLAVQSAASSAGLSDDRTEMKMLHERNVFLQIENRKLTEALQHDQQTQGDIDRNHEELVMLHEQMKSCIFAEHMEEQAWTNDRFSVVTSNSELHHLREVLIIRDETIDELETEIEQLSMKMGQLSHEQDNKEQHFKVIVDSNLQLSSEKLDTLKQQLDRISLQKQDTQSLLAKTIREKDSLNRNISVMSNTMQQYKNELEVKQAECVKCKEHVQRLEEQIGNFDREMMEKDLRHEQQMANHKNIMSDMEGKYRTSKEEMVQLRDTSQKLIALKGQNEELIDEVEQLSMELEKFKGFECKDHLETDRQMQKLQCFCKKLEEKLENTKAEISYEDSKKCTELKQQRKEKAILETQTSFLKGEILKREEGSKSLLIEVDNYKDVVKGLTKTVQEMKKELDKYRCNKNPYRPEDIIGENDLLKEEMRERNCEIANLRLTLDEYNRCHAISLNDVRSCQTVTCPANQTQIPSCEESVCAMKELRKLTDDIKNAQSKNYGLADCNQEYAALLQNNSPARKQQYVCPGQISRCPLVQQQTTTATVDKLIGLKGRVENLNQKEQELQYLLNELQRQNKKISRRCNVYGNSCYSKNGNQPKIAEPQKSPHVNEPANNQTPPSSISNDPVFNNYHNQLENAVTKYKQIQQSTSPNVYPVEVEQKRSDDEPVHVQNINFNTAVDFNSYSEKTAGTEVTTTILSENITSTEYSSEHNDLEPGFSVSMDANQQKSSNLSRMDSMVTTRSQMAKRKSLKLSQREKHEEAPRYPKVSIKMYDDKVLYPSLSAELYLADSQLPFLRLQSPIPMYIAEFEARSFASLHFNTFYTKIPATMYARRQNNKLTIYTEYNYGVPVVSGGPLKCPYKFWQLHFHWGDNDSCGSEHTVNDKRFIMEMHAIHIKENATIEEALDDPDGFLTMAYFYTYSAENDDDIAMISIIQNFQRFDLRPDDKMLEFMAYFPLDLLIRPFHNQYVTYRGSRSDGSGVENVILIFAPFTNKISRAQMEELRNIKSQLPNVTIRPLQKANNRMVVYAVPSQELLDPVKITSNIFLPINNM